MGELGERGARDGPGERMRRMGASALSNSELLAIVLGGRGGGRSGLDLARVLAQRGLRALGGRSPQDLRAAFALSVSQAARVASVFELAERIHRERWPERPQLSDSTAAARLLLPRYSLRAHEVFGVLCLDARLRLLAERVVSTGGRSAVSVTPADVLKVALAEGARSIIAFHNHPSGDPSPSFEDRALTDRLAAAGDALGIPLRAHLIVGASTFFELQPSSR